MRIAATVSVVARDVMSPSLSPGSTGRPTRVGPRWATHRDTAWRVRWLNDDAARLVRCRLRERRAESGPGRFGSIAFVARPSDPPGPDHRQGRDPQGYSQPPQHAHAAQSMR